MKTMLVRLDDGQAAELQTVARVDRLPIADEIREAIAALLEARRADPEFQRRLHLAMERDREQYLSMCVPAPLISLTGGGVAGVVSDESWNAESEGSEVSEGGPA